MPFGLPVGLKNDHSVTPEWQRVSTMQELPPQQQPLPLGGGLPVVYLQPAFTPISEPNSGGEVVDDCGGSCAHCSCCGKPCDRVCCAVSIHKGYRSSSILLLVASIVQFAAGLAVYTLTSPIPGPGAWWCGIISSVAALIGIFGSCNTAGVSFFLVFSIFAVVTNAIGLCIDGPRLSEFGTFRECCTDSEKCVSPPGYAESSSSEAQAALLACLNQPRKFFYPDDPHGDDILPNMACAASPVRGYPLNYYCTQLSPTDDNGNNIFFFSAKTATKNAGGPSWLWETYAPRLRICVAVDVVCIFLCLFCMGQAIWVLCKTGRRPPPAAFAQAAGGAGGVEMGRVHGEYKFSRGVTEPTQVYVAPYPAGSTPLYAVPFSQAGSYTNQQAKV